jgi:Na+/melibiose symporter-like transporter
MNGPKAIVDEKPTKFMGGDLSPSESMDHDSEKMHHAEQLDGTIPVVGSEADALRIAKEQRWQADRFIEAMEQELEQAGSNNGKLGGVTFKNPKHFTWAMVIFASMGGMLFGLDQSLISGANLFLPDDLGFNPRQVSLVNSSMPLGAVAGAILLSPTNEFFGRRGAIILATILYTVGAALEAGAINYPMMIVARLILGLGVGIETGTVPIYVAESVERRLRGNLVSLYQFNIALGEVLGFVVAAIFLKVKGNWRYILGSSVVFSIIMFIG